MTALGTYQIAFPDFAISFPEPQFRADARPLYEELRAKFLAGMAAVYDKHAEIARRKYNELDPATERPPIARDTRDGIAILSIVHPDVRPATPKRKKPTKPPTKKRAAKSAPKRRAK